MYVVTFYSFKGGVGRSMSLVNIGVQLAQAGKKILLVDFDLEAPGLPTFALKRPDTETPGIVEYVSHYVATGESPDVAQFVYESERFDNGGSLWVMPSGHHNKSYSYRLNSLDWKMLYSECSGYLFFEDLKSQWAKSISPDYVLVDSRTGHSDVEGICTRQLPNAVCLLFFPNEQNLNGIKRIVANINEDNKQSNHRKIKIHFVMSNVPDLDDEDGILRKTMNRFRNTLGYRKLAAEIHHYNSLSLLNQEIFSLTRPNSRLSKEYAVLKKTITRCNLGDRDAMIALLESAHRNPKNIIIDNDDPEELEKTIQEILRNFPKDGEMHFRVALVFEQIGNSQDALRMLSNEIVTQYYGTAAMYATRARLNHRFGANDKALHDLQSMLDADGADIGSFLGIASLIDQLQPELYDRVPDAKAFITLPEKDQILFVLQSSGNRMRLQTNIVVLQRLLNAKNNEGVIRNRLRHDLSLALVGAGAFNAAVNILTDGGTHPVPTDIPDAFNLAMAVWGRDQSHPVELFEYVAKKAVESSGHADQNANYMQCLAIAHAAINNTDTALSFLAEARKKIMAKTTHEFSAWSYLKETPEVFSSHLGQVEQFILGEKVFPSFIGIVGT